jgi:hypothetical protein
MCWVSINRTYIKHPLPLGHRFLMPVFPSFPSINSSIQRMFVFPCRYPFDATGHICVRCGVCAGTGTAADPGPGGEGGCRREDPSTSTGTSDGTLGFLLAHEPLKLSLDVQTGHYQ